MTSYFDLLESTVNRLAVALYRGEYMKAMKLTDALRAMIYELHSAQHEMGGHLEVDVQQLKGLLDFFGVKEEEEEE